MKVKDAREALVAMVAMDDWAVDDLYAVPVLCALVTGRDPDDLEEYRAAMAAERRLVYVLTPERVYPSPR